jgi:hypothetical protein
MYATGFSWEFGIKIEINQVVDLSLTFGMTVEEC